MLLIRLVCYQGCQVKLAQLKLTLKEDCKTKVQHCHLMLDHTKLQKVQNGL